LRGTKVKTTGGQNQRTALLSTGHPPENVFGHDEARLVAKVNLSPDYVVFSREKDNNPQVR